MFDWCRNHYCTSNICSFLSIRDTCTYNVKDKHILTNVFFILFFAFFFLQSLACVDSILWFQLRMMYSGYIQWEHDQLSILIAVVVKLM